MPFKETGIKDLLIFEPKVFKDDRGYFYESYNQSIFHEAGIKADFVQDNQSQSSRGVLRGMHYQLNPHAQAKLVRVISGEVQDVAVDIREGSPTFGKSFSINLSAENCIQLYIPRGFAHGFLVLSETAEFAYKCDGFYSKESEGGIIYNDPTLAIEWQIPESELILSDKDREAPSFAEATMNFQYEG